MDVKNIPYRVCDRIQVQQLGNRTFYFDFFHDLYFSMPTELHDWIISGNKPELDGHLLSSFEKLVDYRFVEPDLSKITVGQASIYVPAERWPINERVGLYNLYVNDVSIVGTLLQRGFSNEYSKINLLLNSHVDVPVELSGKVEISGKIIMSSFRDLYLAKEIVCQSVRIENPATPTDEDIVLLSETLYSHPIHIALPYTLSEKSAQRFLELASKFKHRRLSIAYDSCVMCTEVPDYNNISFCVLPGIPIKTNVKISCGAGVNRFFIDKNGHIHPCFRMKASIGNIFTETPEQFIASLNEKLLKTQKHCKTCDAKYFCGGGCKLEQNNERYIFCGEIKNALTNEFCLPVNIVDEMRISSDYPLFDIELVKARNDLEMYEYLCEINARRVLLLGYGIKEPLQWMRCGLFLEDEDFSGDGRFSTTFRRPILHRRYAPIIGETHFSLDWDIIDAHLSKRFPVLISVDVYHMPYKYKTYYHSRHGSHVVVLLEKSENGYMVLDWYHPDYFFGEVSIDDLNTARTSANERDQFSVFTGHPINASYCLMHMDKLPAQMNPLQHAKSNLYQSMKSLLAPTGPLAFLEKASKTPPEWVTIPGHEGYKNAIESFFFFDLELKLLIQYYESLIDRDLYYKLNSSILLEAVVKIRKSAEALKNRIILRYFKNRIVDAEVWTNLTKDLTTAIADYCEKALKILKTDSKTREQQ